MSEKPMFYQGQRVVCIARFPEYQGYSQNPLVEGKSYYIENPDCEHGTGRNIIAVTVMGIYAMFNQQQFIPYDTDQQLEEEIKESLNRELLIK